jgi:hypothetical protein
VNKKTFANSTSKSGGSVVKCSFVLRIKFSGGRQFSSPKSPTSYSCKPLATTLKNDMVRQFIFAILTFVSAISIVYGQTVNNDTNIIAVDSIKFKSIQYQMIGCWKTKYYQFKYDQERNLGYEYKSRIRSSAPIFNLKIIDNEIFIEWIELTGGGSLQKILKIKKNKLTVENESGMRVTYKRNKDCT